MDRELVLRWAPIPGTAQEQFFDDDTPDGNLLFQGGWASGKTMTLTAKMLKLSALNAPLPGLWTVPDYAHIHDTILPLVADVDPDTGDPWFLAPNQYHYHETRHTLSWLGGGPIHFVSAENPKSIAGPNMAFAGTDEPGSISQEAWRNTCARVRHPGATLRQKVAAGTPEGLTYLVDYFGPDRPDKYRLYQMRTLENTELLRHNPEYVEQARAGMTEAEALSYLDGKAVNLTGAQAYPMFDPERHWRHGLELVKTLPLCLAFDFNVDPMTCEICQVRTGQSGPELLVLDSVTLFASTVQQVSTEVAVRYPRWPAGLRLYGDATGKHRSHQSLRSNYDVIREILGQVGPITLCVPEANPPVARRLNSVNALFRNAAGLERCWIRKTDPPRGCPTRPLVLSLQQTQRKSGTDDIWKKPGETVSHHADALGYLIAREFPAEKPRAFSAATHFGTFGA